MTALYDIRDFIELGGTVLFFIMLVTAVMWVLILERLLFLQIGYRQLRRQALTAWQQRQEQHQWFSQKLKQRLLSLVGLQLTRNLNYIRVLVAVAPLLGLLGTVTGMLEVFNVMAVTGTGNVRAMAAGVSKATIPTMAGMVTALSGLLVSTWLDRRAIREKHLLDDQMTFQQVVSHPEAHKEVTQ